MGKVRLKLDQRLKSMNITRYRLSQMTNIKFQTIDRYYKNQVVRYDGYILAQICTHLECDIGDIIEFIPE